MGDNGRLRGSEKNKAFCCVAERLRVFPCACAKIQREACGAVLDTALMRM